MDTTHTLYLSFLSNVNETVRLTIPRANSALEAEDVETGMQALIDLGIVLTKNGIPVGIKSAELLTKQVAEVIF